MSESSVVDLKKVSFSYDGPLILENVNLSVYKGDFACIVGPNGGGKTTLLKLILGLLHPDCGEVRVFGEAPEKARPRMGYMPQHVHPDPQFPVTVMDVVLMGALGHKLGGPYSKADREGALTALEEVDMANLANRLFSDISGGQRQRVLIARALCCRPELLLLDEPTAGIDLLIEERLFEILQELNKRMTIMIVSHDTGFVSKFVKSVICVNRRVFVHPTSDITGEMIQDIYGGDLRMVRHDHRLSEGGHTHG